MNFLSSWTVGNFAWSEQVYMLCHGGYRHWAPVINLNQELSVQCVNISYNHTHVPKNVHGKITNMATGNKYTLS